MKLQIELNEVATAAWSKVSALPEFAMSTKAGIVYQMMHRYLNPQAGQVAHSASKAASNEPETPHTGAVALRHQAEADAKDAAQNDKYRTSGVWPIPDGVRNGNKVWLLPKLEDDGTYTFHTSARWTPPEDYPGIPHTDEERPVHQGFAEAFAEWNARP